MMQLIQIPLIAVGRTPAIKRNNRLGKVVFSLDLCRFSIAVCYVRLMLISGLVG